MKGDCIDETLGSVPVVDVRFCVLPYDAPEKTCRFEAQHTNIPWCSGSAAYDAWRTSSSVVVSPKCLLGTNNRDRRERGLVGESRKIERDQS